MSDDEEHSSIEDDFSASEDEWKPGKSHRQATEDDSDDDDSDFEDGTPDSKKRETKSHLSTSSKNDSGAKQTKKRKTTGASLRTKLFNKYKPPPKTLRNQSTPSRAVAKNRSTAQSVKKTRAGNKSNVSDSDSSGDDYLVNPDELDLQSSFFDVKPSTSSESAPNAGPPVFDCNAGIHMLTDSEGDDDDDDETESSKDINNPVEGTSKPVDLGYLQDFAANMEKAKVQYKKHKERSLLAADTKVDVTSLLALGEGSTAATKKTKNPKRQTKKTQPSQAAGDTDSDWEEVEGVEEFTSITQPSDSMANGIQVSIDLPQRQRKDKKSIDAEATLKRQLNRIIKENQLYLHKTSLLCHIYNGLFLNRVASNTNLMPIVLKLLPSKNVYPSGQTEIKYFQSMVTWFKTAVKLHDDRMYPQIKLNAVLSLAVQMKHRHAVCKRDFILMFVILLRAMGMQCRLIINMVPLPLKPAQSSLCSLKMKPTTDDGKDKKTVKKELVTTKKESEPVKKESIKSSALSKEEREELKMKMETLETEIKKKKNEKLQSKPSFEDELKVKSVKSTQKTTKEISAQKDDLKRKSLDKSNEPEKKKKVEIDPTKSKYFPETKKTSIQKVEPKASVASAKRKKADLAPSKSPFFPDPDKVTMQQIEQKEIVTNKVELHSEQKEHVAPKRKKKVELDLKKSPYFPDPNFQASLKSHSETVDDQPSISINSKRITKPIEKLPKIPVARTTRTRTETVTNLTNSKQKPKVIPDIVIVADDKQNLENITNKQNTANRTTRVSRSRSKSPKAYISTTFLHTKSNKDLSEDAGVTQVKRSRSKSPNPSVSAELLKSKPNRKVTAIETNLHLRKLRSKIKLTVPQLDGADDVPKSRRKQNIKKTQQNNSDDDFQPSVPKRPKAADKLKKPDRQVLSPDTSEEGPSPSKTKKKTINMWVEVYCELEEQWVCIDLFKGKVHCLDSIRKSVTPSTLAYVFAFNNDATMKDVTPRYCAQWAAVVRKGRVEQSWLDEAIREYVTTYRTQRDLTEDMDLRRIHLDKPMPTTISEHKDHPLYALERHLLKFQAIYPPNAVTLGFVRGEAVYARECIHTLHSREIWLKSARVVKLGEQPYKIVKARPKWDKFTSTVIKDQPLEIFGYWQTQDYDPPTAENGIVPRNAYGNVELFKECMLPKKTVHLHLPGLNRVCKKLGIDCVPAVVGFDFHQGACHPLYDGFVVCEEFAEMAADAWDKDQQEVERKEQEKYEARVFGNWKKLIRGLLIRERLKLKYNF